VKAGEAPGLHEAALDGVQLVEASAGTGKTWTICGLYLRLLLERPLDVSAILVVTFTTAARDELRERIRLRIEAALQRLRGAAEAESGVDVFLDAARRRLGGTREADAIAQRRLAGALQRFDEAAIQTIHGFSQRALADAPFVAGVPLSQELIVDDEAPRMQVVLDFWRRRIAGDALALPLAAYLDACGDTPQAHERLLKRRLAKPLALLRWPDEAAASDEADPMGGAHEELRAACATALARWRDERAAIVAVVDELRPMLHKTWYSPAAVAKAIESWDRLAAQPAPALYLEELPNLERLCASRMKPTG